MLQNSLKKTQFGPEFKSFVDEGLDGSQDLKRSLQQLSSGPEGFFHLRNNFLTSHATSSVVSWIMTIGDRHSENLLISKVSGESIQIDFGYAFGATFFLPVPELGKNVKLALVFCRTGLTSTGSVRTTLYCPHSKLCSCYSISAESRTRARRVGSVNATAVQCRPSHLHWS